MQSHLDGARGMGVVGAWQACDAVIAVAQQLDSVAMIVLGTQTTSKKLEIRIFSLIERLYSGFADNVAGWLLIGPATITFALLNSEARIKKRTPPHIDKVSLLEKVCACVLNLI